MRKEALERTVPRWSKEALESTARGRKEEILERTVLRAIKGCMVYLPRIQR
jgi:hypothetical protein